jgi:HSP20 family protein
MSTEGEKGGLAGLIAGLSRLAERLEQVAREGEIRGGGPLQGSTKGPMKGVFGWSLKLGLGDKNEFKIEPFGNLRSDDQGEPHVEEEREPLVDVFDEGNELTIVAEMPGVEAEDVRVSVDGTRLTLSAERGERKYKKQLDVPFAVQVDETRGQNGIIEVRAHRHG